MLLFPTKHTLAPTPQVASKKPVDQHRPTRAMSGLEVSSPSVRPKSPLASGSRGCLPSRLVRTCKLRFLKARNSMKWSVARRMHGIPKCFQRSPLPRPIPTLWHCCTRRCTTCILFRRTRLARIQVGSLRSRITRIFSRFGYVQLQRLWHQR